MKAAMTVGVAVFMVVATLAAVGVDSQAQSFNYRLDFDSRVLKGFDIAPVPIDLRGLDPTLVGLGSYIVNAQGGCNDCHTSPSYAEGGNPFNGEKTVVNAEAYLAGGACFGPFVSRNLTPRANGNPANLTLAQFRQVLRKGTDFKNRHPQISPLLQVMPWPLYGNMNNTDIRAVYEYLKSIPSLPTPQVTCPPPTP